MIQIQLWGGEERPMQDTPVEKIDIQGGSIKCMWGAVGRDPMQNSTERAPHAKLTAMMVIPARAASEEVPEGRGLEPE